jgi:Fic family protein
MRGRYERRSWQHDPTAYAPPRHRRACAYDVFLPDPLDGYGPSMSAETSAVVSDAEQALVRIGSNHARALAPLARLLLRTESIASSKVEGLAVDVHDLARGEARADTGGRLSSTTAEVLANIGAMELAVEDATAAPAFDRAQVTAIHARLMATAANQRMSGRIRTTQNWIGGNDYNPCGADFVPPPPEMVSTLLDDVCGAVRSDALPPLVQAALVHAQFETIHPFDDGNGRTGRALVHVVLRRRGLTPHYVPPISVVFAADREGYIAGLVAYRDGDVDAWVERFAVAAKRAADLAAVYLDEVAALTERWRGQLRAHAAPRADAAAWAIIEELPAHPVINSVVAAAATGRAKAAVHAGLEHLEQAGVLVPLSAGRRNRTWEAAGLLDLVSDLEDGSVPGGG